MMTAKINMGKHMVKVGIIGAGQLARMLVIAGVPLGLSFSCIGKKDACATDVSPVVDMDLEDTKNLLKWAESCDVVTFENENIHVKGLESLKDVTKVYPNLEALSLTQDRLKEKNLLRTIGAKTAAFYAVDSLGDMMVAVEKIGLPGILKTRRFGYDGKGQKTLKVKEDIQKVWNSLSSHNNLLYEKIVDFDCEVSQICTFSQEGKAAFYPLSKNTHHRGILLKTCAPFTNTPLEKQAQTIASNLAEYLEYVGTLGIEFFVCNNELVANEVAPRVHNSGHWTIEGAHTSQFENHLRAICGLTLGDTTGKPTIMLNCIGGMPPLEETCATKWIKRHDYNKNNRSGRKVGHITIVIDTKEKEKSVETVANQVKRNLDY